MEKEVDFDFGRAFDIMKTEINQEGSS
jgi:hypothetical protein